MHEERLVCQSASLMLLHHAHDMVGVTDSEEDMGSGTTWLPNQDWNASRANSIIRPGIVHRLDKGTTGLLVVAKDPETLAGLAAQFKAHTVSRSFLAMVAGHVDLHTVDGSSCLCELWRTLRHI